MKIYEAFATRYRIVRINSPYTLPIFKHTLVRLVLYKYTQLGTAAS